jgi:hypothetical protein
VLYRPSAFEALTDEPWRPGRVRDAITGIASDTTAALDRNALWPADEWDGWGAPTPMKNLYVGAAGVVAGLDVVRRRGLAELRVDLAGVAQRALEAWCAEPDFMEGEALPSQAAASLLRGETGILLVAFRMAASRDLADRLLERVRANAASEAMDLMWGAPGTLLAARAMLDWTGDARWATAWRDTAATLLRNRDPDGLWTQPLILESHRGLDPTHGLVGNVRVLLDGGDLLVAGERNRLVRDAKAVLRRAAVLEGGAANWPAGVGDSLLAADDEIRMQWCCGAPGVIVAAADYLDDDLLLAGGALVWQAGPPAMSKGPGICHGTAGNGYALLKLFRRTGDEVWLDRARRFAIHALGQVERGRMARGRGRYSLFTGDIGAAIFASDCLQGAGAYPVIETWD